MNLLQESSFYQMLLEEGELKGRLEGRLEEARELLILLGQKLIGPADAATRAAIDSMDDLERLRQSALRVLSAKNWEDLLAGS